MDINSVLNPEPLLKHRFGVFFLAADKTPNPLDIRFQKVSGLSVKLELEKVKNVAENAYMHVELPKKSNYPNLKLERGYVVQSPLSLEINAAFSLFQFYPSNVLLTILNDVGLPQSAWLFMQAFPVSWELGGLDANANEVVLESMELKYTHFQAIQI